ncbi:hypothetical protein Patl1_20112 [Pistacia atlantica]|uniref:Uncharacterized protein n=1 Tax=Pistacia atlantica TaxID=434234 RepID=A0ACC1BJY5_9ROSI|nr:hypothetical protein Patl1_20112 [Pistacia atlantica]
MGKAPCCDKDGVKKGAWSPEEDAKLIQHIKEHGHGNWRNLPKEAGLFRCGKSCRLRWINYLRPDIKRGPFSPEEEATVIQLHGLLGNNTIKLESPSTSTSHTVQWESIRVEAEVRLSMESSQLNSSLEDKTDSDIFLRLWNSRVGKSFCSSTAREGGVFTNAMSETLPTELESDSIATLQARPTGTSTSTDTTTQEQDDCYRPNVDVVPPSDTNSSNDFPDSFDTALMSLLDFPSC